MPSMRVFELAKELNMPARQMIQKLRSAGVPVSGNFHELTEDQVSRLFRRHHHRGVDVPVGERRHHRGVHHP